MRIAFHGGGFPDAQHRLSELLPDDEVGTSEELGTVDVLIPAKKGVDADDLDRLEPRLVQNYGAGYEQVDLDAARERHIAVTNIPAGDTGNAAGVAEIAVLHLLSLCRGATQAREAVYAGRVGEPMGLGLEGRVVTLLGAGDIGREIARRLRGFGPELIGVGRREEPDPETTAVVDRYLPVARLAEALGASDDVIVALPLSEETRGILGGSELAALRGGGFVVNVGRGPLVGYDALLGALRSGQVGGAGLDVFWSEPIDPDDPILSEHVSVTPHIGGLTERAWTGAARRVAENVERLRDGRELLGRLV
jgi:phosphoglycerate dehydrogenase-like enzyme